MFVVLGLVGEDRRVVVVGLGGVVVCALFWCRGEEDLHGGVGGDDGVDVVVFCDLVVVGDDRALVGDQRVVHGWHCGHV